MFSGIIEEMGKVERLEKSGSNLRLWMSSPFTNELKVDQSVSHNGVCLTVTEIQDDQYSVDIIQESLNRSNLGDLGTGNLVNLERSVRVQDRLDGHIVQGHVDQRAVVKSVENNNGSWTYEFEFDGKQLHTLIEKGSICVNGVSLTLSDIGENSFQVSIIPYTYEHTNFKDLKEGDHVNIEFDVIGKYIEKLQVQS